MDDDTPVRCADCLGPITGSVTLHRFTCERGQPLPGEPDGACPACGFDSIYARQLDRFFHIDGSDNIDCWCAISRGDVA